jgi:hypothetical protein
MRAQSTKIAGPHRAHGPLQRLIYAWICKYPGTTTPDLVRRFDRDGYKPHSVRRSIRVLAAHGEIVRPDGGGWSASPAVTALVISQPRTADTINDQGPTNRRLNGKGSSED